MDRLELTDRLAIRRLVDEYAAAVDQRDGPRFAAVFSEEGVLVSPAGRHVGRGALSEVPGKLERYLRTFHLVANHVVDLAGAGDGADGVTYTDAHHWYLGYDGVERDRVMHIRYLDRFVREPGGMWRIAERTLEVVGVDDRPTTIP